MAQNANEQLIKNLKDQLTRLVDQLKDLDECRYFQSNSIKSETIDKRNN